MSPAVQVQLVRNGRGMVALRSFAAGDVVCDVRGRIVSSTTVWAYWEHDARRATNCIRFGPESYLDPGEQVGAYANHSCQPNTLLRRDGRRLLMVAVRAVRAGAELTHDYSTFIGADDVWTMRCNCGARSCRGRIGRFDRLPAATLARYRRLGMLPEFIEATAR